MSLNLSTEPWPEAEAVDEGVALAGSGAQQDEKENSTFSTGRSVILRPPLFLERMTLNDLWCRESVTNSTVGPDNLGPGHCGASRSTTTPKKSTKNVLRRSDALGSTVLARRLAMKKPPIYRGVFALRSERGSPRSRKSYRKHTGKRAGAGSTRSSTVKKKVTGQATSLLRQKRKGFLRIEPGTRAVYGGPGNEKSWMFFKNNQDGDPFIGIGNVKEILEKVSSQASSTSSIEASSARASQQM